MTPIVVGQRESPAAGRERHEDSGNRCDGNSGAPYRRAPSANRAHSTGTHAYPGRGHRAAAEVREPYGKRRTASVDEADVADVVTTVLAEGGYAGKSFTVTGPEALTPADKVAVLAAATGREIRFTELTDNQARRQWRAEGWPEAGIEFMLHMWATVPDSVASVTSTVEEVLGRPPRTFAQ